MFDLSDLWRSKGVPEGGVLLLHSSAKRTLKTHGITPRELLQSFIDAVGDGGTLCIPAFTFAWCRGEPVDIVNTPAENMGVLCAEAMRWPGAALHPHPVYRTVVIGRHAQTWRDRTTPSTLDTSQGLGRSSIFGWLHHIGGTIGVLDLPDQNSQTFYHYVEQCAGAKWRSHKSWRGQYTDENGETTLREYSIYVRKDGVETHVDPMGSIMWRAGLYRGDRPHTASGLRTIKAVAMYDFVSSAISAIHQGAMSHKHLYLYHEQPLEEFDGIVG